MSFFRAINRLCDRRPYLTQGLVASVLQVTGDVISQKYFEKKKKLDYKRSFNFMIVGFFTGVMLRKWYGELQKNFVNGKPMENAIRKVIGECCK